MIQKNTKSFEEILEKIKVEKAKLDVCRNQTFKTTLSEKEVNALKKLVTEKNLENDNSNLINSVQRVSHFNILRKNAIFN